MPIRWGSTRRLLPGVAAGDTAAVAQKLPRILSTHVAKAERLCTLPAASRATRSSHLDLNVSGLFFGPETSLPRSRSPCSELAE